MLKKKYNFLLLKRRDILNLHFKSVNKNNRKQIELLSVAKNQAGFVESVTECLEDAKNDKSYEPVGIYDGNTLIGFAMYGLFTDTTPSGEVWLDRLLIDEHFQSKGYGKNAILKLLKMLKDKYKRKEVYLTSIAFTFLVNLDFSLSTLFLCTKPFTLALSKDLIANFNLSSALSLLPAATALSVSLIAFLTVDFSCWFAKVTLLICLIFFFAFLTFAINFISSQN